MHTLYTAGLDISRLTITRWLIYQ